ncbi:MAG: nucleoside deaminase [Ruminococcus callidus]
MLILCVILMVIEVIFDGNRIYPQGTVHDACSELAAQAGQWAKFLWGQWWCRNPPDGSSARDITGGSRRSPLAHAEIMAIDAASRTLGGWRLLDSALYVTLEPCPMCAGAILHARLEQVVYGTADPKGGAVDSVEQLFTLPYNWTPEVHAGLLQAECAQILRDFFRELRLKKQAEKIARNGISML